MAAAGLKTHIWNNNLRSLLLLALYPFFLAGLVWAIAAASYALTAPPGTSGGVPVAQATQDLFTWWPIIASVVAIWFTIAWFFNTGMVRMLSHARPATRREEPALYNLMENLCISRGMAMPRLEIIESPALNAFASGVDDKTYTITVTRGLLERLQADELEAVLGHELTHILNRDVRLLIVSVIFTGMIGFAAQMVWNLMRGGLHLSSSGRGRGGGALLLLIAWGILMIGYGASLLTRFALSRAREFMADAGSVELTHNPDAMMRALQRISGQDRVAEMTDDIAMMCIENSRAFLGLFATHPPIAERIAAISTLTGTPVPDPTAAALPGGQSPWRARSAGGANPWT